jgi:hypothetical protein
MTLTNTRKAKNVMDFSNVVNNFKVCLIMRYFHCKL